MRYPSINKSFNVFAGYPEVLGNEPPLINFYTAEDIIIELPLFIEDEPVSPDKWVINAILKAGVQVNDAAWVGVLNNGIYHEAVRPSIYKIIVPSAVTSKLKPGTYWLDVAVKEKLGISKELVDRTVVVARLAISLDYSASSVKTEGSNPPFFDITRL